ncbi:metal-dependent hydrolase family protein [Atribacter laminatus]|uniref:Imidazolonepropionase n=1 Tax=Atribacter laminatus TaxID=2847778 RepID=A0A7T1AK66_ATRLM|nr:amidohydrolase family protein [Atribacter laminatus]QPM67438.1 Imidazolonepropionase [Atribacter laminatus]
MQKKVIQGGVLLDGTGNPPVKDAVVVIEGNKITKIGKKGEVKLAQEKNVDIIEAKGKTIMPGMIDSHVHIYTDGETSGFTSLPINYNELALAMRSIPRLKKILEMGITSLRDGGSGWGWLEVALRDAINRGDIVGPRFVTSGYHLTVTGGHGHFLPPWLASHKEQCGMHCDGPDEWRKAARLNIYNGTDNVKVVASRDIISPGIATASQPTLEELTAAIEEAHKMGKGAIAHAQGPDAIQKAIKAGANSIVHGFFLDEKSADMMVENNVFLESTNLYVKRVMNMGKGELPDWMVEKAIETWEDKKKNFKMYLDKGIKISFGSDCGVPFLKQGDNALELVMFVELGMSPMAAIVAATKTAAEAIGYGDKVGTIEEGKFADIIMVDGNPLDDISILSEVEKIKMVMKDGNVVITR